MTTTSPRIESFVASTQLASSRLQQQLALRKAAATAFWIVFSAVRTAALCTTLAWLATFVCSRGSLVTPVREQSYAAFVAGVVAWMQLLLNVATLVTLAIVLKSQRFVNAPDRAPTFLFCFSTLVQRTYVQLVGSLALMVAVVYVLSNGSADVRALKLEFYVNWPVSHLFTAYADLVARNIVRFETVWGQQRARAKQMQQQQQVLAQQRHQLSHDDDHEQANEPTHRAPAVSSSSSTVVPVASHRRQRIRARHYWWHYAHSLPVTLFVVLAGGYVHAMSFVDRALAQQYFVAFALASTLFKIGLQASAKCVALQLALEDVRIMCVVIGTPTVLVDTQVRMVLQTAQTNSATYVGTALMALVEIVLRLAKVSMTKYEIRRLRATTAVAPLALLASSTASSPSPQSRSPIDTVAVRERRILTFHSAECYADMAAEYIAIGCSAAILFFFSAHPKYALGAVNDIADASISSSSGDDAAPPRQFAMFLLFVQVAVETIVDWLASVLEITSGVDFARLLEHQVYIAAFFASLAAVNIQTAAVMYAIGR